jgi:hypothetical protein
MYTEMTWLSETFADLIQYIYLFVLDKKTISR